MAPLRLNCPECDAPLTVRDPEALAGKRVKCPKCGTAVRVPEPEDEDEAPKARGPAKAAARRRDDEDEERPARRTRADEDEEEERPAARRKRAAEDEEEDERPASRRKRAAEDDGDEDERPAGRKRGRGEDEDRPKKKGKKAAGNPALVRNIIGGVVLVAAVTAAIIVWVNRSKDKAPGADVRGADVKGGEGPPPGPPSRTQWVVSRVQLSDPRAELVLVPHLDRYAFALRCRVKYRFIEGEPRRPFTYVFDYSTGPGHTSKTLRSGRELAREGELVLDPEPAQLGWERIDLAALRARGLQDIKVDPANVPKEVTISVLEGASEHGPFRQVSESVSGPVVAKESYPLPK